MKYINGIASTTHIDRHYEQMTKNALDGMVKQINEKFIPLLIEHDPNKHVGVIFYGEVFQLRDGEYALGIIAGIFETDEDRVVFETGKSNDMWSYYKKYFNINDLLELNEENSRNKVEMPQMIKSELNIVDLLEIHLDSTQVLPDGTVYGIKRFIASTGDLRIEVYPKDHDPNPTHFHVISKQREINARFDIHTLDLISTKKGKVKQKDIRKIKNFFETRPDILKKLITEHLRLSN